MCIVKKRGDIIRKIKEVKGKKKTKTNIGELGRKSVQKLRTSIDLDFLMQILCQLLV